MVREPGGRTPEDDAVPDTSPDLAEALQLGNEETLTGPPGADPLDAGYVPADRPYGVDDPAVTAAGQRDGESHEERLRRELPDEPPVGDVGRSGRLTAGAGEVDGVGADVGFDGGAASAEEAAMHEPELGIEPVLDESPLGDPEVTAALEEEPWPPRARRDAERDLDRADAERSERAARIDAHPDTGGVPGVDGRGDAGIVPD